RKYQWYTNEGQTVLRQAQLIQLPSRSLDPFTYVGVYLLLKALSSLKLGLVIVSLLFGLDKQLDTQYQR
ncbi:MAG: hypothetical protein EZS28_043746, partial [Streblomastix strix]